MAIIVESRAVGGPLAGVKLTAMDDWNGVVKDHDRSVNNSYVAHSGHYRWSYVQKVWVWRKASESTPSKPSGFGRPFRRKQSGT